MIISKAISKLTDSDLELCHNLLMNSPDKHIFNDLRLHLRIQDYFKDTIEGNVLFFAEKENIFGYIILYNEIAKKLLTYFSPYQQSLITYGGIVCPDNPDNKEIRKKFLKEIIKFLGINSSIYIKSLPGIEIDVYNSLGYNIVENKTLFINTQSKEDELWEDIKNRIKWNINKAYQSNIKVKIVIPENTQDIDPLFNIYAEVCKRTGLYLHNKNYYFSILDNNNFNHSLIFYAYYNDTIISTMAVLYFDNIIISWFGGSYYKYRNYNASSLIYWEIIKYASQNNFKIFDLLGLDIPNIAFFKKGFGGYEVPVYHITYKPLGYKVKNKLNKMLELRK